MEDTRISDQDQKEEIGTVNNEKKALPTPVGSYPLELTEQEAILLSKTKTGPLSLFKNAKGKISASSFANYVRVISGDAYLAGRIKFNMFDGRQMVEGFYWDAEQHPIRDNDMANLRYFVDCRYMINNEKNLKGAILKVACDNPYHPVRDFLNRLEWDGVERIHELLPRYLGAERSDYTTAVTQLLFNGAIQRVFNPGCKFDYCIILADTKQGTGKSTMCRFLALTDEWYTDSIGSISDSKSTFELMRGKWIVELGELLLVRKASDVETVKAFITRQTQDYREPYGIFAENHPRQSIFIGTTNKPQFLPEDKTGNRRFLPIICDGVNNAEHHPLDDEAETRSYIQQCYAEAMYKGRENGFPLVLDKKFIEELQQIQTTATPEDTRVGMIQEWLDKHAGEFVCSRMIWDNVFGPKDDDYSNHQPQKYELHDISDIMNLKIDGWEKYRSDSGCEKKKFPKYGSQRAWRRVAEDDPKPVAEPVAELYADGFKPVDDDYVLPFS